MEEIQTNYLIVGAGPAGASLACFLASHGLQGILISESTGGITTPRAHITNMAALECLRDIGLEEECIRVATPNAQMSHTTWCYSMSGEEYTRIHAWGSDPARQGDYFKASPCQHVDLPQTLLEPILTQYATRRGFWCRFNTEFLEFDRQDDGTILSTLKDNLSNAQYKVRSKYLFGCDGARSRVLHQLQLPLIDLPGGGLAFNVLARADLTKHMTHRRGCLHWVLQPDRDHPDFAFTSIVRMVKPWHEWVFIFLPDPSKSVEIPPTEEQCVSAIRGLIQDDSVSIEILDIAKWKINETVAKKFSDRNIFCLGDAVHRHPPFNGLGSNTCIQDAFNLAWKVAYVAKGLAHERLLETYSEERQPVGVSVVTRANQGLREQQAVWEAFGMLEPDKYSRLVKFNLLKENSPLGSERRRLLSKAIRATTHEFHALGIEMNQRYNSLAVFADQGRHSPLPVDAILEHHISTHPGCRLPHAWLNTALPSNPISTIDLAGHGNFVILTGIGGGLWKEWAKVASVTLGIVIKCYSIGWRQDYEDMYFDWEERRGIAEDGCLLVRPDRFICWRCKTLADGSEDKVLVVLKQILGKWEK